jgi:hypothetical protein
MSIEEKESVIVPEDIEKTDQDIHLHIVQFVINRLSNMEGERGFQETRVGLCPKHGWIQEDIYIKEIDFEKPLRLSMKKSRRA